MAGILLALAVPSAAAAARVKFAVTVRGTIELAWQDTIGYSTGGCDVTAVSSGSQRFEFRSTRPARLTVVVRRGRPQALAGSLGALAINATGSGETALTTCGQTTTSECLAGEPSFTGATVRFSRHRRGMLQLTQLLSASFAPWQRCLPQSLADPTYPLPGSVYGAVVERALPKRRTTTVRADRELVTRVVLPGEEQGTLTKRVIWTLTFKRLGR